MNKTINYYNEHAINYTNNTQGVDMKETQDMFLSYLHGKSILDFGCGSGRDTKYFLNQGYDVEAIDGSIELCKQASLYTGIDVKHMYFQELDEYQKYDGIFACSSILHLNKVELRDVFYKMIHALKDDGIIYTSFKYSTFEGYRNDRYFTDFTCESFQEFIQDYPVEILNMWKSEDRLKTREGVVWLNIIIKKTSF